MITETTAVTLRQNLRDMLNRVQYRHDSILITKDGKPVAALVDAAMFERIRRMQQRFDALSERLAKAYEPVAEDAGTAEIDRVSARARRQTADRWRAQGRLPAGPARPAKRAGSAMAAKPTKAARAAAVGRQPEREPGSSRSRGSGGQAADPKTAAARTSGRR